MRMAPGGSSTSAYRQHDEQARRGRHPGGDRDGEAIDFNIKTGRMLYPNGSRFEDAEKSDLAAVLARAADEAKPLVLCYQDGTRRIVEARTAPNAA